MSNEKELQHLFKSNKKDIPDHDFSKHVMRRLLERKNLLPFVILMSCFISGVILTIFMVDPSVILQQFNDFAVSFNQLQIPSQSSISTLFISILLAGVIAFAWKEFDTIS